MDDAPIIKHGGSSAYYALPINTIQMPLMDQFESPEAYYATLFHELIHSTGHHTRLYREEVIGAVKFGSLEYSRKEPKVEIGAAFLCNIVGIENPDVFENAAAYIQGWFKVLQDDKKCIFQAATQAKVAMEYITP